VCVNEARVRLWSCMRASCCTCAWTIGVTGVHAQVAIWMEGASAGFYQGSALKLMEDLAVLRPTLFPSVPRLVRACWREGGRESWVGGRSPLAWPWRCSLWRAMRAVLGPRCVRLVRIWCAGCRLYNRIYDKLILAINTTPGVKGKMLRKAYATKTANLRKNILNHPFWCDGLGGGGGEGVGLCSGRAPRVCRAGAPLNTHPGSSSGARDLAVYPAS
jgi:hypothetical protein